MLPGVGVRAAAARVIDAVLHDGRSLKSELATALPSFDDSRDRALLESICFHALRHRRRYAFALEHWMPRPLPAREHQLYALLLVGLAQLDALQLPAHAAVSVTAEAARVLDRKTHVALVNALLRRATREPLPVSSDPAIDQSFPDWLLARIRRDWPDHVDETLDASNTIAPQWLRVNAVQGSRDAYAACLREADVDIDVAAPDHPARALCLPRALPIDQLPGWRQGVVSIQDAAAQLAVEALSVQAGERVLDACAAPGGKTAGLLESHPADAGGAVELVAVDNDQVRLQRVTDTLRRLQLDNAATLICADAGDPDAWWDGKPFDAILLDAPCSATGIIRRQPDIKWHRRESDLAALTALQDRLLDALWTTLKPGGRLLYATCSILREENAERVDAFLARTPDAQPMSLDDRYGHQSGAGRQRLPGEQQMDGFFYALLSRQAKRETS
ncbi:MAG: 16S rRNA (cytosine(967)-C(5))-methyltransferase RsmB [Lysobacteraceae bacterium]